MLFSGSRDVFTGFLARSVQEFWWIKGLPATTVAGVKQNFWLAKFLTSHHVRMHRLIFYIENTLINLIMKA